MAKMKIYELAKELDMQSKEIVAFLTGKGVEVKNHMSSIEDDIVSMVKKAFQNENAKAEQSKEESKAEVKEVKKEDVKKAEAPKEEVKKTEEPKENDKKEAVKKENAKKEAVNKEEGKKDVPKKKKNIIFVSNPHNSKISTGAQRQNNPNGGQRTNNGNTANNNRNGQTRQENRPYRPLPKPTIKPVVIERTPAPQKPEQKPKQRTVNDIRHEAHMEKPAETVAQNRNPENGRKETVRDNAGTNRNNPRNNDRNNNQGNRRPGQDNRGENRGDNRGGNFRRDDNRSFGGNDRGGRQDNRQDNRQGGNFCKGQNNQKGFVPENPVKEAAPHRDEEKRRKNQERDSRSRKDLIYEEDGANFKGKNKPGKFIKPEKKPQEQAEEQIKVITIPETITIKDLADKMKIQPSAIIKKLFMQGKIVTVNQEVDFETAEEIAIEYEIICEQEVKVDVIEELLKEEEEAEETMKKRPPVICVMGHVDHGKTSLLDAIRKTNVTDREAGGITQHIGAYTVKIGDEKITFLDTPGHEAFTAMRMRGANSTDIAILVVAADDGVMPQTVEAINHAKAAGIEIIVAVNKIDKPNANIERVKQELMEYELIPVDWGGTTEFVPVSAKSGEGIDTLLETIILTAEILELKANPDRKARGLVVEAELDKGRGPVATVLVQKGTLHVGDFISAGASHGKVRAMIDDKGRRVKEAGPSTPVEILGLSDVPNAGEIFIAHENDKSARNFAETFIAQNKEKKLEETKSKMSLDDLFSKIQEGNLKELNLIIKADVQGSVEAVKQSLLKLSNEEIVVKCIHGGVGAINESDVTLASASAAIIIGFNVRPDATAKAVAEREGVDVRLYNVIYQAIEDVEAAMKGMLDPVYEEQVIGHAEVRQIFKASAVGNIAGSYVLDGRFERNCKIRITREGEQIYEGELASLKRFKDDVKEVKAGYECGLVFDGFDQMQELDIVEAYIMVEVPR